MIGNRHRLENFQEFKGLTLGLWYLRDSPFELEAYTDSDYAGNHNDRKSTTGGCQFLGKRLISWQCKNQTIVATHSSTVTPGGLTHSSANQDIPTDIFVTPGNMPISTGSGTIPAGMSVPTGSLTFPAGSEQVPPVSTSVDKGKAQLVDEPTPTQERTFKQLEDKRLGWEAVERLHAQEQAELERQKEELLWQDELLARQLDQDFDIHAQ
ncbi:hypothetical protein Tco_0572670 [Tanacetum coccineum]